MIEAGKEYYDSMTGALVTAIKETDVVGLWVVRLLEDGTKFVDSRHPGFPGVEPTSFRVIWGKGVEITTNEKSLYAKAVQ